MTNNKSMLNLEPRLREYIEKKRYYIDNNIEPVVPLEDQYDISENDKKILRSYMRGDVQSYKRRTNRTSNFIDTSNSIFPSSEFKYDERMDRLKQKQERDKMAQDARFSYSIINQKYSMYNNDYAGVSADSNYIDKTLFTDVPTNNNTYTDNFLLDDDNDHNPNLIKNKTNSHMYHNPPKIQYNMRQYNRQSNTRRRDMDHNTNVNKIIGELDSYSRDINRDYQRGSNMDTVNKIVIPNVNTRKDTPENNYMNMPYMRGNGNREDVDVDTYVRFGVPSRGSKSLGYNNPVEHQFQYITSDIQDPNHVVMDRGEPTRLLNKQPARPKKRDVM